LIEEPDITLLHMVRRHLSHCDVIEIGNREDLQNLIEQHQPVALIVDLQDDEEISSRLSLQEFVSRLSCQSYSCGFRDNCEMPGH
jgi:hypothetical protein